MLKYCTWWTCWPRAPNWPFGKFFTPWMRSASCPWWWFKNGRNRSTRWPMWIWFSFPCMPTKRMSTNIFLKYICRENPCWCSIPFSKILKAITFFAFWIFPLCKKCITNKYWIDGSWSFRMAKWDFICTLCLKAKSRRKSNSNGNFWWALAKCLALRPS